jgi:hypothetical protein
MTEQRIEDTPYAPPAPAVKMDTEPRNMAPWPVVPKVYRAINKVQAALAKVGIAKDRKNVQQSYSFRGVDDMYNVLCPLLSEHGLCILPRMLSRELVERVSAKNTALFYVTVDAEFDFVCAEDGSKHTVKTYGEAMDIADKATNKAMSAAYKYACMQAFSIPTQGDNDADATTHDVLAAPRQSLPDDELEAAQMTRLARVASTLIDLVTEEEDPTVDNEWKIWEIIEPITDNGEKMYLGRLLGPKESRVRSRMKEVADIKRGVVKPVANTTRVQTGPGLKKTHVRGDEPEHPARGNDA